MYSYLMVLDIVRLPSGYAKSRTDAVASHSKYYCVSNHKLSGCNTKLRSLAVEILSNSVTTYIKMKHFNSSFHFY